MLQSFCTTGLIFGWPALVKILKDEGLYASLCEDGEVDCAARKTRFSFMFFVAQSNLYGCMGVWGILLDRFGPRKISVTGMFIAVVGLTMFASATEANDIFLPALVVMGCGGAAVHMSWFHISNLFPARRKTVSSLVVGALVGSGLVFVVYEALVSNGICSRRQMFAGHAVLAACLLVFAALLWPESSFQLGDCVFFENYCLQYRTVHAEKQAAKQPPNDMNLLEAADLSLASAAEQTAATVAAATAAVHSLSLKEKMLLPSFLSVLVFYSCNYLFFTFFVGTPPHTIHTPYHAYTIPYMHRTIRTPYHTYTHTCTHTCTHTSKRTTIDQFLTTHSSPHPHTSKRYCHRPARGHG
jgi:MFS family permease